MLCPSTCGLFGLALFDIEKEPWKTGRIIVA